MSGIDASAKSHQAVVFVKTHAMAIALVVVSLVLIIFIVRARVWKAKYDTCSAKTNFLSSISDTSNLRIPGCSPQWANGSSATGGLFQNDPMTARQSAVNFPQLRFSSTQGGSGREGLTSGTGTPTATQIASAADTGYTGTTTQDYAGGQNQAYASALAVGGPATCGVFGSWDPEATAEAQALGQVGSYENSHWGQPEVALQYNIDLATDSGSDVSQSGPVYSTAQQNAQKASGYVKDAPIAAGGSTSYDNTTPIIYNQDGSVSSTTVNPGGKSGFSASRTSRALAPLNDSDLFNLMTHSTMA